MAKINYSSLTSGYTLKIEDNLLIHGYHYTVVGRPDFCWLANNDGYDNAIIFKKLDRYNDRQKWAKEFDDTININSRSAFPEFRSLEKLTSFVRAIYETPGYKVGTKVRVKKRIGLVEEYPYHFVDEMTNYEGEICTIKSAIIGEPGVYEDCKYYDGDIYRYEFEENDYTWSSSMFELVNVPEDVKKEEEAIHFVTLEDLKDGYIFKKSDHININGMDCVIHTSGCTTTYWLSSDIDPEGKIYESLGISEDKKKELAKSCCAIAINYDSPEFGNLERLSKFVKEILMYKKEDGKPSKEEKPKKDITYEDLIDGYVLQEEDKLILAGDKYKVQCGNFLVSDEVKWDTIFDKVGVEDKDEFCDKFGDLSHRDCIFPEFKTAEGLTKCVIELMERADHISYESPEPFAVSMDYEQFEETTDTGIVRLPEIKDDFKIIIL